MGIVPTLGNLTNVKNCYYGLNPVNNDYPLFISFWEETFSCFYNSTDLSIPLCSPDLANRSQPIHCRCTGNENLEEVQLDASL